jgi:hypothetical protein
MTTTETYKDVPEYEGLYRVSDQGNVYSIVSERILKPWVHTYGYHRVNLYKNWVRKYYSVHRLVALTFISNPESKEQVNHIDWVKTNNSLSNLEWCTNRENAIHSMDVLGNWVGEKHSSYGKFLGDHNSARGVIQYDLEWNEIERYSSITGARLATWVNGNNIWSACRGKLKSAGWFRWKYS